ncbi:hypothetical protein GCM10025871_29690 [Deinococcus metallilatus]|nr:hypothetical protein GCM10025871_29690 [Deinococcus metallilatus]
MIGAGVALDLGAQGLVVVPGDLGGRGIRGGVTHAGSVAPGRHSGRTGTGCAQKEFRGDMKKGSAPFVPASHLRQAEVMWNGV